MLPWDPFLSSVPFYVFKIVQNKRLKRNTSVFLVQHN